MNFAPTWHRTNAEPPGEIQHLLCVLQKIQWKMHLALGEGDCRGRS
jgi:hypothetical protein